MFVLVRHAHAGDKHRWTGPDRERPLSRRGQGEALGVADLLTGLGVRRLISRPAAGCTQTLAPTAERLGIPVEEAEALAVGAPVEDLLRLLESPAAAGAALCTHGETLNALSQAWAPTGRVAVAGSAEVSGMAGTPKGASWVVEGYPSAGATARHVPARPLSPV